uniref:SAM domain-containing protein n=1 Tax=Amphimedon queenslandica TaxID=400682 RepID=A0A1X7T2E8_AMPQE
MTQSWWGVVCAHAHTEGQARVTTMEKMSGEELREWLVKKGYGEDVVKSFVDNEMDGESLCTLFQFESSPGPDCLRELVPKLGIRLRLYKDIKEEIKETYCNSSV